MWSPCRILVYKHLVVLQMCCGVAWCAVVRGALVWGGVIGCGVVWGWFGWGYVVLCGWVWCHVVWSLVMALRVVWFGLVRQEGQGAPDER